MWRSANVHNAFNLIRRCIDQGYRIRSNGHYGERLGIRRVAETMNKKLSFVERTKCAGNRIAESDHTEQLVLRRIDHRNRVRGLIGSVNAVVTGDRNVWPRPGRLLRYRAVAIGKGARTNG